MDADGESHPGAGRIHWRSRRGMLEVEIELVPFARDHFGDLSLADQAAYARFLEADDWQIHDWLRGRSTPEDAALERIVTLIERTREKAGDRAHRG